MNTGYLPVPVSVDDPAFDERNVLDRYLDEIAVGYTAGPPYGEHLVTWVDMERIGLPRRELRRLAAENLDEMMDDAQIHGQPPVLMLSFDGMEASLLLADAFWDSLEPSVPGELVVGAPARDVVLITGSQSRPGVAKAQRAVDRVFYARGHNLLVPSLLARRDGQWEPLNPT